MNQVFVEQTSTYESVWSVSYLQNLFECSTVIGHDMCILSTLISLLHNLDTLMKTLAMFITHVSKISRKFIEMDLEEMNLYAHDTIILSRHGQVCLIRLRFNPMIGEDDGPMTGEVSLKT